MSFYDWFTPGKTRAADGIKAKSRRGKIGERWWSQRFIKAVESLGHGGRLSRGRSYARRGQVLGLEIEPGSVHARVQGSRRSPYKVTITFALHAEKQWDQLASALAAKPLMRAELLAGEMPDAIETVFQGVGLELFPESSDALAFSCSCPDWGYPCKHGAAVCYLLAERLDDDPTLLFTLRGRSFDDIQSYVRDHDAGNIDTAPLGEAALSGFWTGGSTSFEGFVIDLKPPTPPHQIVLQLGEVAVNYARRDLTQHFTPAYQVFTAGAAARASGETSWLPIASGRRRPDIDEATFEAAFGDEAVPEEDPLEALGVDELIDRLDVAYDTMSLRQRAQLFRAYGKSFGVIDLGDDLMDAGELWRDKEALFDLLVDESAEDLRAWLRSAQV